MHPCVRVQTFRDHWHLSFWNCFKNLQKRECPQAHSVRPPLPDTRTGGRSHQKTTSQYQWWTQRQESATEFHDQANSALGDRTPWSKGTIPGIQGFSSIWRSVHAVHTHVHELKNKSVWSSLGCSRRCIARSLTFSFSPFGLCRCPALAELTREGTVWWARFSG